MSVSAIPASIREASNGSTTIEINACKTYEQYALSIIVTPTYTVDSDNQCNTALLTPPPHPQHMLQYFPLLHWLSESTVLGGGGELIMQYYTGCLSLLCRLG